jgi:mannose/fructose/N-acetylgalactosamine-specific phosphotransferase system component IIC
VLLPVLKRQNEALALGYVTARIVESTFIAIGIVSLLAIVTLRRRTSEARAARARSSRSAGRSSRFSPLQPSRPAPPNR